MKEARFARVTCSCSPALAPVVPQILGSAFNIWYNAAVISQCSRRRYDTVSLLPSWFITPLFIRSGYLWLKGIFSFRDLFHRLQTEGGDQRPPLQELTRRLEIMNDFFRVSVRAVEEEHRGMVNRYLGDGLMAIFGAGDPGSNHACDAVSAGCEILRAVKGLNDELGAKERAAIQIRIGIHSSLAIVGSVGSPQRLEFTAIGNTVNVASRIQGLPKTVGRPLLVTEAVRERSADSVVYEELPPPEVRGIKGRVIIFAVPLR